MINDRMIVSSTEKRRKSNQKWLESKVFFLYNAEDTLKDIEKIEKKMGKFKETSFVRSPETNEEVGGVENSNHIYGKAVDGYFLQYSNPRKNQIEYIAKWIKENTKFNEIIFYPKKLQWHLGRGEEYINLNYN